MQILCTFPPKTDFFVQKEKKEFTKMRKGCEWDMDIIMKNQNGIVSSENKKRVTLGACSDFW